MNSLTARVLAFALPALGIVVSGQHDSTQPKSVTDAPQAQSRLEVDATSQQISIVERLPDVEDEAVASFLNEGKTPQSTTGSNQLAITTSEDWISGPKAAVAIIERLPPIEDEFATTVPVPLASATNFQCTKSLAAPSGMEECHEDEPRSFVAPRSDYVSVSKKPSQDVSETATPPSVSAPTPAGNESQREILKTERSSIEATIDKLMKSNLASIPTPFKKKSTQVRTPVSTPSKVDFDLSTRPLAKKVRPLQNVRQPITVAQPVTEEPRPKLQQPIARKRTSTVNSLPKPELQQSITAIKPLAATPTRDVQLPAAATETIFISPPETIAVAATAPRAGARERAKSPKIDVTPIRAEANEVATSRPGQPDASHESWTPVDLRTVDVVDTTPVVASRGNAVRATHEDRLRARRAVQLGFELVQRRANFSARARFVEALRIVARSLDDQTNGTQHTTALRHALSAYEEAGDFFPGTTRPDEDVNLYAVVGGHDTPVLQGVDPQTLTSRQCVREYMAYSEQELRSALGSDEFASQALYGLGRLESATEATGSSSEQVRAQRSLTLYQAALLVDKANFSAANELGVLLAKYGRYQEAVVALRHCVQLSPQPTAWKNLSNIYRRLGQAEESRMAAIEANRAMAAAPAHVPFVAAKPRVQWVDAETFASLSPNDANVQVAPVKQRQASVAPSIPERQPTKTAKRRFWFLGRN